MKKNSLISLISLVFILNACSSFGGKRQAVQLRPMQEKTLTNGLRVMYIRDESLPRVSFSLMVMSGSAQDPKGSEGLAQMTVSLLEQGSAKRNALQVADDFAQLGSNFSESASADYVMMSTAGLAENKDKLLELFADVVLTPSFAGSELERKRSQVVAELTQQQDRPTEYISLLFDRELFGNHPYAHPVSGTVDSVKSLTRSQVIKNYFSNYRPNNAMLAVTGSFDEAFQAQVEKTFSRWLTGPVEKAAIPVPAALDQMDFKLYAKSGLQQTQIRLGHIGIARTDADFLKLRLANVVVGGSFASRLNQKVRDDMGLTYSISSHFDSRHNTGSFEVSTFARNDKVGDAIKATLQVLKEYQEKGATSKELEAAKALLVGQFPAAIETVDRLAFNLMVLRLYGVSDAYLTDFFNNVNSISLKDVNAAIKKHFHPEQMKVVLFADEKAIADQVKDFKPLTVEKVLP